MSATVSPAVSLASRPETERAAWLADCSDAELHALEYQWSFWARPNQLPPSGDWTRWLLMAGRGNGKTRTGGEFVRAEVEAGRARRVGLVAPTAGDARDIMVEGESGILAISPPWFRPVYEPSKRRLTWPNGARATLYSADEPDRLRGPQHDLAWGDEIAAWRYSDAYDQLMFGLRLGLRPRACFTTTPKPVALVKDLLKDSTCVVTRGTTYENAANLAPAFLATIVGKYEGTRLGRQELMAEMLEEVEGALWTLALIDRARLAPADIEKVPMARIVVAVDPNVTSDPGADEAGIVVAALGSGLCPCGKRNCGYVLDDHSGVIGPPEWSRRAVEAYRRRRADRIVAEENNGGELVESTIRVVDEKVAYRAVHASKGKLTRAEPVEALYEQGRVHHVGSFPQLEEQMSEWVPTAGLPSPGRMDALVWAITELMLQDDQGFLRFYQDEHRAAQERAAQQKVA